MTSISDLKLRPVNGDDFNVYRQLVSDPEIAQGARFKPAKDQQTLKRLFKDDLTNARCYAVTLRDRMIGMIALYTTIGPQGEPNEGCLELADMMLPKYQDHGYMNKAVGILIKDLKRRSHVRKLVAVVNENNLPSRKVLIKNKFRTYRSVLNMTTNSDDLIYQLNLKSN